MFGFETEKKERVIQEMFDRVDEIISELQLEYADLARRYDEAQERIEDLESELMDPLEL